MKHSENWERFAEVAHDTYIASKKSDSASFYAGVFDLTILIKNLGEKDIEFADEPLGSFFLFIDMAQDISRFYHRCDQGNFISTMHHFGFMCVSPCGIFEGIANHDEFMKIVRKEEGGV